MAKSVVKKLTVPFQKFFELESSGGIILIFCTLIALLLANSAWSETYFSFWETKLSIGFGEHVLSKSILIWVNDALMAIFFFVVGLEIKREIMAGELSSPAQASLPIVAALGGMIIPALFFILLAGGGEEGISKGWGIPMATDIAFSLGILKLLGKRVPLTLKIFLTAFAIVDDIGAVLVIALFYTSEIVWSALMIAGALYVVLVLFNVFYMKNIALYMLIGAVIWFFFLKSGIHPTVAGVMVAFVIPARRKINIHDFLDHIKLGLNNFSSSQTESKIVLTSVQINAINTIEEASEKVQSPLQRIENELHGMVIFFIMPVFALANAGVAFGENFTVALTSTLTISIAVSLVLGKVLGITLFTWIGVKTKITSLPTGTKWIHIIGLGFLGGIGFTMSLFIANLAFGQGLLLDEAKIGILIASLIAGLAGYFILKTSLRDIPPDQEEE